jgi:hypothetical protein
MSCGLHEDVGSAWDLLGLQIEAHGYPSLSIVGSGGTARRSGWLHPRCTGPNIYGSACVSMILKTVADPCPNPAPAIYTQAVAGSSPVAHLTLWLLHACLALLPRRSSGAGAHGCHAAS